MRFLGYSRSSIAETVSHSYVVYDQQYIDDSELEKVKRLEDIAWKKINNFISYLNKTKKLIKPIKPIEPIKQMKQNTGPYREPNV